MYLAVIDYYKTVEITKRSQLSALEILDKELVKDPVKLVNRLEKGFILTVLKKNKSKRTPDIGIDYGIYIVSEKFKLLCENLEVKDFDFFPTLFKDKKGNIINQNMFVMIAFKKHNLLIDGTSNLFETKGKFYFKSCDLNLFQQEGLTGYLNTSITFKRMFNSRKLYGLYFVDLKLSEEPLTERLSQIRDYYRERGHN